MNCWMCDPTQYAWLEYADLRVSRLLFQNEHTYVIIPRESHVKHHLLVVLKEKNGQHKRGLIECSAEELAYLGSTISYWCSILKKMKYDTVYTGCYSDEGHIHFHLIPLIHAKDKGLTGSAMQWLAAPFPPGWRAAERSDYSAENLSFINNRVPNHMKADFNGDGINDDAWILINQTENKYGLFIFLGKKGIGYETVKLCEYPKETDKLYMGISFMKPGRYKTACRKGYWDCRPDEPKILTLTSPGINFFAFESSNSVV